MLDMLLRCGARDKTRFIFLNTGIECRATLDHLSYLEEKYDIQIERVNAIKAIPTCVREYGAPFINKEVSSNIDYLQLHNFQWEDEPFDVLLEKYPSCKSYLKWWCNYSTAEKSSERYMISRYKRLKEFMIANPPTFKISGKCCTYAKKKVSKMLEKSEGFDLKCLGLRKSEGGVRASTHKNCFTGSDSGLDNFRPIFWLRDKDKEEYCEHYGVTHSACYTEYGFKRTGCVGCPFNLHLEDDLKTLEQHEPALYRLATTVFRDSYEYTRAYHEFRKLHS